MKTFLLIIFNFFIFIFLVQCKSKPYSISGIEGKTYIEVLKDFGKPEYEYNFPLTDTVLEYRYGLLEKFPNKKIGEEIIIKELNYKKDKNEIFIWFKQNEKYTWKVVGSLVVPSNVKI